MRVSAPVVGGEPRGWMPRHERRQQHHAQTTMRWHKYITAAAVNERVQGSGAGGGGRGAACASVP